jgi:N-methylhydantoinase B
VNDYVWVKTPTSGANADPFAAGLPDMAGERVPVSWGVFPLMGQDALYVRWNGGGGIGDPLEREPAAVARDVVDRAVSPIAAEQVYGVVFGNDGIDVAATRARRATLRRERMAQEAAR